MFFCHAEFIFYNSILLEMPSSISTFPNEEFTNSIQGNYSDFTKFITQVYNLNTQWIYEIVKICHNAILDKNQLPSTKLNALLVIKDLIETCQVPCLNLIQVYILPEVYKIAIQKPQEKGQRRGSTLFYHLAKSSKIPNVQQIGIKFITLCSQILYAGAMIKTKKLFENFELKKKSDFADYFDKYKEYQIWGTPTSPESLKNFSKKFIERGREDFLKNLKVFSINNNDYCEYFATKIIESLQTDSNPLLNNANQQISLQNDLDMRKLLKTCDPILTSPLVQQCLHKLKTSQNFMVRKNYLSLLTDFIKWGDAQAIMRICQDNSFQKVGIDFYKTIEGKNGLNEGEKIYPQIRGQLEGKRKFYIEYLKSLQIVVNCIQNQKIFPQQTSDLKSLYNLLKNDKKYAFPQNLMAKKIETEFHNNLENNYERNVEMIKRLRQSMSSISKTSYRGSRGSKNSMISAVSVLQKNIENCLDDIQRLCSSQEELEDRMKRLQNFKNQFEVQYQYLNEKSSVLNKSELHNYLMDGQQIIKTINRLDEVYNNYKQKKINFKEFKNQYAKMMEEDSIKNSFSSDRHSNLNIKMSKQSVQQVISSYKPEKVNLASTYPIEENKIVKSNQQQFGSKTYQNGAKFIQSSIDQKNINLYGIQKNMPISDGKNNTARIIEQNKKNENNPLPNSLLNTSNLPKSSFVSKYESFQKQSEIDDKGIKQKKEELIGGNKQSKISEFKKSSMNQRSNESQRQSMIEKKNEKQNESKLQKIQFILSENNQNSILPSSINNTSNQPFILSSPTNKNSQIKNGQKVQYIAPPSFRVPDTNQRNLPNYLNRTVETNPFGVPLQDNYSQTAQNFVRNSVQKENNQNGEEKLGISSKQNGSKMEQFEPKQIIPSMKTSHQVHANKIQIERESPKFYNTQGYFNQQPINRNFEQKEQKSQFNSYNQIFKVKEEFSKQNSHYSQNSDKKPKQISKNREQAINQTSNINFDELSGTQNFKSMLSRKNSKSIIKQSNSISGHSQPSNMSNMRKNQQKKQASIVRVNYNNNRNNYQIDDDIIKQPENHPANDSYYGIKDIENQVKNSVKPEFKYCFQLSKQYLPSNHNSKINYNNLQYGILFNNQKSGTKNKVGSQLNGLGHDHQSYLISKIKRQYEKQKDSQTKQLQNRILELKKDSSRLRNQIIYRENSIRTPTSRSKSRKDYESDVQSFSNSKSSNSSPIALRPSRSQKQSLTSVYSSIMVPGVQIHDNAFEMFLSDLNKQRFRKCCLKNKSLLLKNQVCQVGYMFCKSQDSTKIILYFTPFYNVNNFSYSISKEPNLDLSSQYKGYGNISENMQIKIEINAKIKNIPYHLPMINIMFNKGTQKKSFSLYLPLTFNKFVNFNQINPNQVERELSNAQKILRTQQFQLNPKVVKSQNLSEYFPNLTQISEDVKHRTIKYASKCSFKNNNFSLFLIKSGNKKMILQGVPQKQSIPLQYLMSTIKKLFEKQI